MTLEKEAQARSWWNQLRLKPKRWIRRTISPKYHKILEHIEKVDDAARKTCLNAIPTVKQAVKDAKSSFKARKYERVMHHVYLAFKEAENTWIQLDEIIQKRDELWSQFREEGDMPSRQERKDIHERFFKQPKAASEENADLGKLIAEARSWAEFWRGSEGGILEKMVGGQTLKKQKDGAYRAIGMAEQIESQFKQLFKDLDSARSDGDVARYIESLRKYKKSFDTNEDKVKDIYTEFFAEEFSRDLHEEPAPAEKPAAKPEVVKPVADPKAGKIYDPIPAEPGPHAPPGQAPAVAPTVPAQAPAATQSRAAPSVSENASVNAFLAKRKTPASSAPTPPAPAPAATVGKGHKDHLQDVADFPEDLPIVAASISKILIKAEHEYNIGNKGIASALLAKASQICEDNGDIPNSIKFLVAAQRL